MLNDVFLYMDLFVCICWLYYAGAIVVGKKQLESAVLHCLCLLELALQKEVSFMDLLRESQSSLLVSPVEQILQGVSAQSRRADHITNIARSPSSLCTNLLYVVPSKIISPKSCQECFNVSNTCADLTCLALTGTCTTAARTLMLLSRVPRFCAVSHATQTSRPDWLETSHMIRQETSHCILLIQIIGVALNMTTVL